MLKHIGDKEDKMELTNLKLIPLYANNIFGKSLRLGGSYLKIFPLIYSKTLIKNAQKAGFSPHIYIHPYEFDNSDEFKISTFFLGTIFLVSNIQAGLRIILNNFSQSILLYVSHSVRITNASASIADS